MLAVNPSGAGTPFSTMWRRSPTWFFRQPHPPPRPCCNRRALSPSFSEPSPIRSAADCCEPAAAGRQHHRFSNVEGSIGGKWLELLKQIAPRVNRVALLFNPATATYAEIYLGPFGAAAAALAVEAIATSVDDTSELESAVGGFMVIPDPFMSNRSAQITSLTARHRLPAIFPFRYYAKLGGLLSYGSDQQDNYRRAAAYIAS
jgi:hypothetical protein